MPETCLAVVSMSSWSHNMRSSSAAKSALRCPMNGWCVLCMLQLRLIPMFVFSLLLLCVFSSYAMGISADITNRRAEFMHDALVYGFQCMSDRFQRMCQLAFMRTIRFKVMERRSRHMYNRAKLRKWLRICVKYRYVMHGMNKFHTLRTKYRIFMRWLQRVNYSYALLPRDRRTLIRRRLELMAKFSSHIAARPPEQVRQLQWDLKGLFTRWVEYTQSSLVRKTVVQRFWDLHAQRLLSRAFWALSACLLHTHTHTHTHCRSLSLPLPFERWPSVMGCSLSGHTSSVLVCALGLCCVLYLQKLP